VFSLAGLSSVLVARLLSDPCVDSGYSLRYDRRCSSGGGGQGRAVVTVDLLTLECRYAILAPLFISSILRESKTAPSKRAKAQKH